MTEPQVNPASTPFGDPLYERAADRIAEAFGLEPDGRPWPSWVYEVIPHERKAWTRIVDHWVDRDIWLLYGGRVHELREEEGAS